MSLGDLQAVSFLLNAPRVVLTGGHNRSAGKSTWRPKCSFSSALLSAMTACGSLKSRLFPLSLRESQLCVSPVRGRSYITSRQVYHVPCPAQRSRACWCISRDNTRLRERQALLAVALRKWSVQCAEVCKSQTSLLPVHRLHQDAASSHRPCVMRYAGKPRGVWGQGLLSMQTLKREVGEQEQPLMRR